MSLVCAPAQDDFKDAMSFNNCCLTITDVGTPDPFVIYALGKYYMVSFPAYRMLSYIL
jgi:hypothetical protein